MSDTHDYPTRTVKGSGLDGTMTLVGESGGLSSIYDAKPSSAMPGLVVIETEHGALYLDPDGEYEILTDYPAEDSPETNAATAATAADNAAATPPVGPRIMARFHPQVWVNDNAMDVDGSCDFDVTEPILAMGRAAALAVTDGDHELTDALWDAAVTAGRADAYNGPYYINIEEAIQYYFEDLDEAAAAQNDLASRDL